MYLALSAAYNKFLKTIASGVILIAIFLTIISTTTIVIIMQILGRFTPDSQELEIPAVLKLQVKLHMP